MGTSTIHKPTFLILQMFISPLLILCDDTTLAKSLGQSSFPSNFLFGTASSAYQFEGAYLSDGKGLNNWDVFSHKPGNIIDGSNGDLAVDHYYRYMEDIELMGSLGVNSYRFSISWARILPAGRFGEVNLAGIDHYNKLIDVLLLKGIQPFVTLNHFDIPQELEDRFGGWLSPESQEEFLHFADICFKSFGDRVKYWATFNEPNLQVTSGYRSAAVDIFRSKYQKKQGGMIGIVLYAAWFEPISNSTADKSAAERAQSFLTNWILDPIILGRYPSEMNDILGSNLPEFSNKDKDKLKSGLDFIGINHYTSYYVQDCISSKCEPGPGISKTEGFYLQSSQRNGVPIGEYTDLDWLNVYPQGLEKTITYIKERYNNTPMFITENGYGEVYNPNSTIKDFLHDVRRVNYIAGYLNALSVAIRKGADVRGYFAWSLLDNFEWIFGYTVRFGLHHVDHATLKRTPKLSASWYKQFITKHKVVTLMPGPNQQKFQY
ncbi:hypothetical protein RGQ29_019318 [Quercus rubra]|uniref:Beta-glucosidase n=1 Tax=Quercus rubra TaxID=3512 RepID=A0AAN7FC37_QUERU|nr:hypothetical protein RGQ29_019318 [Quercus rubra]